MGEGGVPVDARRKSGQHANKDVVVLIESAGSLEFGLPSLPEEGSDYPKWIIRDAAGRWPSPNVGNELGGFLLVSRDLITGPWDTKMSSPWAISY
jgi:hypothetical protein